jgi:hypothetical protein
MLHTSLDKVDHLSALKRLATLMPILTDFDPALVAYCFDVFIGCINVSNCEVVVIRGLEQLATVSALCFFHTISQDLTSVMNPTSSALKDVCQRYSKGFPANIDFRGHEFSYVTNAVHSLFVQIQGGEHHQWGDYKPSSGERATVAHTLAKLIQLKYQGMRPGRFPGGSSASRVIPFPWTPCLQHPSLPIAC